MSGVAGRDADPELGDPVPGDDRAGDGGDVDDVGAEPLLDDDFRRGQLRWHQYRFPRQSINACLVAVRSSVTTTGNTVGGSGRSRSAASIAFAVVLPVSVWRGRSSCPLANASKLACACSRVSSSGTVRHQRCAAVWLFFSTTPFRFPLRGERDHRDGVM